MKNRIEAIVLLLISCLLPIHSWGQQSGHNYYLQTSLEVARLKLSGPSYDKFSANPRDMADLNFGCLLMVDDIVNNILDKYRDSDESAHLGLPTNLLASTHAGPFLQTPPEKSSFLDHISFMTGIQLIGKGGKDKDDFGGTSTTHMKYLEIPFYALYNYKLADEKGFIFGGPGIYVAYGLWGKEKFSGPNFDDASFPAFEKNGGFRRFDAGLTFMAGYQHPKELRLNVAYELGLMNIESGGGEDKTKNRVWSLNVCYPLKKIIDKLRNK